MRQIGIIGMGRVGLTLSMTLAEVGFNVLGIERDANILTQLNKGKPHFYEKGLEVSLRKTLRNGTFRITPDIDKKQDIYIICVGTPIDKKNQEVILDPLVRATEEVSVKIKEHDTVIVRSTVPVGTTRNIVLPILSRHTHKFSLSYCPERTIEGNALVELRRNPQIISGLDEESVERATVIFSKFAPAIVYADSIEDAELIKLIDNTYRDINFAFANEIALMGRQLGLDGYKLIRTANFGYPRNNIPIPGFVGGVCLSKDPYILRNSVAKLGYDIKLVERAREINENLPIYVAQELNEGLASMGKAIREAKIFIIGLAFKGEPRTDDLRDSPALGLIDYLRREYNCEKIYGYEKKH